MRACDGREWNAPSKNGTPARIPSDLPNKSAFFIDSARNTAIREGYSIMEHMCDRLLRSRQCQRMGYRLRATFECVFSMSEEANAPCNLDLTLCAEHCIRWDVVYTK